MIPFVNGFWKTNQIVTLGLFHFIGPANGYTCTLCIHSAITRLSDWSASRASLELVVLQVQLLKSVSYQVALCFQLYWKRFFKTLTLHSSYIIIWYNYVYKLTCRLTDLKWLYLVVGHLIIHD